MGKSSSILGSVEESDETQLHTCCCDLPREVLTIRRGNFSSGKLIYIIHTEGEGRSKSLVSLKLLSTPRGRQRISTKKGGEKKIK